MPERRISLHIGTHKTGTTFLQNLCHNNRETLLKNGVDYLSQGINHSFIYLLFCDNPEYEHHLIKNGISTPEAIAVWRDEKLRNLRDTVESSRSTNLLISGEEISRLSKAGVERLANYFYRLGAVKIYCFVRDPLGYATSEAQEAIKGGLTLLDVHDSPPLPSYRDTLQKFIEVFGKDSIQVGNYSSECPLECAFLELLELSPQLANQLDRTGRKNIALTNEALRILSHINTIYPMYCDSVPNINRGKIPTSWLANISGTPFQLPIDVQNLVLDACRLDLDWLDDTFGISFSDQAILAGQSREREVPAVDVLLEDMAELIHKLSLLIGTTMSQYLILKSETVPSSSESLLRNAIAVHPGGTTSYRRLAELLTNDKRMVEAQALQRQADLMENLDTTASGP